MTVLLVAVAATVIALSMFLRFVPLMKFEWVGIDTLYHFMISDDLRKGVKGKPGDEHFVFRSGYTYPPLIHMLLSAFPKSRHRRLQFGGPLFDILAGVILFTAAYRMLGMEPAIMAFSLYISFPILIDSSWSIGSRSLANFLLVALLSLDFVAPEHDVFSVSFPVEVGICAMILLTHRLYTQILVAIVFSEIVTEGFVGLPLAFVVSVLCLLLTSSYRNVLAGHISFLRILRNTTKDRNLVAIMGSRKPSPRTFLFNSPLILAIPLIPFAWKGHLDNQLVELIGIVISVVALSVAWPLGQGYRHLAGIAAPISLLLAITMTDSGIAATILLPALAIQLAFQATKTYRTSTPRLTYVVPKSLRVVLERSRELAIVPMSSVLLMIPLDYSYAAAYFTDHRILEGSGGEGAGLAFNTRLRSDIKRYGLAKVCDQYDVDVLVISSHLIDPRVREKYDVVVDGDEFLCLQRKTNELA